jgi:hypothetical protein
LPFGAPSPATIIEWGIPSSGVDGVLANVVVINTPLLILSYLYIIYNGLYTTMCSEAEWSSFAVTRKGLRLSGEQRGSQRGNYFLQLPYRFSFPLITMFAILHWLASQSLFLVDIEHYAEKGSAWELLYEDFTVGFSPIAIFITIVVGTIPVFALLITGLKKLNSPMPLAGNCSAVIAAACHPGRRTEGELAAESEVQWVSWNLITQKWALWLFNASGGKFEAREDV